MGWSGGEAQALLGGAESAEDLVEVLASELPFEGCGDLLVAASEGEEVLFECVEVGEVVGLECFALEDGEVDLGLVEPGGVDWGVDDDQVRPGPLESVDGAFAAMGRSVVEDDEHAVGSAVGLLAHELVDETVEGVDPVFGGAAVEKLGVCGVPGGEVAEGALAFVLVLDALPAGGRGRQGRVFPCSGLDRGLLVGADDVVA